MNSSQCSVAEAMVQATSCRGISKEFIFFNTHQDAGNLTAVRQVKTHEIPRLSLGISSAK